MAMTYQQSPIDLNKEKSKNWWQTKTFFRSQKTAKKKIDRKWKKVELVTFMLSQHEWKNEKIGKNKSKWGQSNSQNLQQKFNRQESHRLTET